MEKIEYVPAKSIVSARAYSAEWFGKDYNMNIYRGCSHGCVYCDSRSECYGDDSFSTVKVKRDALALIESELRRKRHSGVIATGAMSDPYNPLERSLELTRGALRLVSVYGYGISIATKSPLITRDADLLREIREHSPVICKLTITSANDELARVIEPFAPASSERFAALASLSQAGIFSGVLLMPVLPYITDTPENIREIVRRAAECGARFIYPAFGVTLRDRQRDYFYERLDESFPGLREKYARRFGGSYGCGSPRAAQLARIFEDECRERGVLWKMPQIIAASRKGYGDRQMSLF